MEAEDENEDLDNISGEMYTKKETKKEAKKENDQQKKFLIPVQPDIENIIDKNVDRNNNNVDEKTLKKYFLEAFDTMNDDFIYIEPKLIPIIPGDDPAIISKISEFNEDNF